MERKTFLGVDITSRKMLWAEIKRLGKQIEIQERHLTDRQVEIDKLTATLCSTESALKDAKQYLVKKDIEISKLLGQLARFDRAKDKNGRFIKKK